MMSKAITLESATLFSSIKHAKEVLGFTLLLDITAVDNLNKAHPESSRFELIYILRHSNFIETIIYKVAVEDEEIGVESISSLFGAAEWAEREVYDQYGIYFKNHKMLKRLLNHNEFVGSRPHG